MHFRSSRLTRSSVALFIVFALILSMAPAPRTASASEIDGDTWTSDIADVSISWDDRVWEADSNDGEGYENLTLGAEIYFMNFVLFEDGYADAAECLDAFLTNLEDSESNSGFANARRATAPESDPDAEGQVVTYVYTTSEGDDLELMSYVECREIDGVFLSLEAYAIADAYEDAVADFEDVLASIESGGGRSQGDEEDDSGGSDSREAGIDGNVFTSGLADVTVTWDDRIWEAEFEPVSKIIESLILSADGYFMQFYIFESEYQDVDECLDGQVSAIEDGEANSDVRKARRATAPETDPDAAGTVLSYVYTNDQGDDYDILAYVECRDLGNGVFMNIRAFTTADLYEDVVPDFEDVIAEIELGAGGSRTSGGGDADCAIDIEANPLEGCITDYTIEYDDRAWTVLFGLYEPGEFDSIFLNFEEQMNASFITKPADDPDPETCLENRYDTIAADNDGREVRRAELPDTDRDAVGMVLNYTITPEEGDPFEVYEYAECRLIGDDYMMQIGFVVSPDDYEDLIPDIEDLLAGIEVGTGNRDSSGSDDEETGGTSDDEDNGRGSSGGSVFIGENYGVEIDFGSDWEILESGKDGRVDFVVVTNGTTQGYLYFTNKYANAAMDCQQQFVNAWAAGDGVTSFEILESDGQVVYQNDADYALGAYAMTRNRDDYGVILACVDLGEFRLVIVAEGAIDEFEQVVADYEALLEIMGG